MRGILAPALLHAISAIGRIVAQHHAIVAGAAASAAAKGLAGNDKHQPKKSPKAKE